MQVTVHEHRGKSLVLLIEGASLESVVDAFWNGLKRPYNGKPLAIGSYRAVTRPGSVLLTCEPNTDVTSGEIVYELRFQLVHTPAQASA